MGPLSLCSCPTGTVIFDIIGIIVLLHNWLLEAYIKFKDRADEQYLKII
jgi:hypothetical protein